MPLLLYHVLYCLFCLFDIYSIITGPFISWSSFFAKMFNSPLFMYWLSCIFLVILSCYSFRSLDPQTPTPNLSLPTHLSFSSLPSLHSLFKFFLIGIFSFDTFCLGGRQSWQVPALQRHHSSCVWLVWQTNVITIIVSFGCWLLAVVCVASCYSRYPFIHPCSDRAFLLFGIGYVACTHLFCISHFPWALLLSS